MNQCCVYTYQINWQKKEINKDVSIFMHFVTSDLPFVSRMGTINSASSCGLLTVSMVTTPLKLHKSVQRLNCDYL